MAALPITRVGFFGGSFNPPHFAHQMCCVLALGSGEVDEVWWVPAGTHAFGKALAPFADRMRMCELATEIFSDAVRVVGIEGQFASPTGRTLDTLQALEQSHPNHRFRLLVGSDILTESDKWYRWDQVIALAPPLVVPRLAEFSSTRVRSDLTEGRDADPLVPRAVMDYIAERGLYV